MHPFLRSAAKLPALTLVGMLLATGAAAHDFFLRPQASVIPSGETVQVEATVSSVFPGADITVTADRIKGYRVEGLPGSTFEIAGVGQKALKFSFKGRGEGLAVLGIELKPRDVEYGEDRIDLIMGEYEVAPDAVAAVASLARPRTLQVTSTRFSKTLVCVSACPNRSSARRPLGYDLEFVASDRPNTFILLSGGRPLADYPVAVVNAKSERRHTRTGADGSVLIGAPTGPTMLFAAQMTAPTASGERFRLKLTSISLASLP